MVDEKLETKFKYTLQLKGILINSSGDQVGRAQPEECHGTDWLVELHFGSFKSCSWFHDIIECWSRPCITNKGLARFHQFAFVQLFSQYMNQTSSVFVLAPTLFMKIILYI